jgi:hypothetical protein
MQSFVEKVLEALTQAGVEFVVVGTQDLDLCYRRTPENVRRLAGALRAFRPKLRGMPDGVPNIVDERTFQMGTNSTLDLEGEDLDLLAEMSGIGSYDDVAPTDRRRARSPRPFGGGAEADPTSGQRAP